MHELWTIYQLILKGTFFGTPCRLGDQKSQISNLAGAYWYCDGWYKETKESVSSTNIIQIYLDIMHKQRGYIAWQNISNYTSNVAHHDIVMVGIKRPRRVSTSLNLIQIYLDINAQTKKYTNISNHTSNIVMVGIKRPKRVSL